MCLNFSALDFNICRKKVYLCRSIKTKTTMPEVSRFYGIIILMFADDHNPPHIHVRYGDRRASITIKNGLVTGQLARKELPMDRFALR